MEATKLARRLPASRRTRACCSPKSAAYGLDGLWNDDFHHAAMVALTGRSEAYYSDHGGAPQEFVSAARYGFLYQGQRYKWPRHRRRTPTCGLAPQASAGGLPAMGVFGLTQLPALLLSIRAAGAGWFRLIRYSLDVSMLPLTPACIYVSNVRVVEGLKAGAGAG